MTKVKLVQKYTTDPQITIPNNSVKFIGQGKEELLTDSDVKPMMIKKTNDVLFCSIILVSKSTISDSSVRRQKHFYNPCQFAKFFSIRYVLHFRYLQQFNLLNPKNNSEKIREYPVKIRRYIDFLLWNSWIFCNFNTKYCQKIVARIQWFFSAQSKSTCMQLHACQKVSCH